MASDKFDPTAGRDSLWKAVRRNLSLRRAKALWGRMWGTLRARGWQAAWREVAFRWNLATHGEVWKYRVGPPLAKVEAVRCVMRADQDDSADLRGFSTG